MSEIAIPDEAIKAAKQVLCDRVAWTTDAEVTAAIRAALTAWPGAWATSNPHEVTVEAFPRIILPLPEDAEKERRHE